jgi:pilus assembly protein Flp/PilA
MLWLMEALMGEVGSDIVDYAVQMLADNSGATAIEYGLIAALIAIAAVGAMSGLGTQISKTFNNASTVMSQG